VSMQDGKLKLDDVLEKAWGVLDTLFPFNNYIREPRKQGYFEMVRKVVKWSSTDAKVLDFGAGPCDKTALFSMVGMQVTALDDMQDAWHKLIGNRERILAFAKSVGIEYVVSPDISGCQPAIYDNEEILKTHNYFLDSINLFNSFLFII
jgi:hypothetical protein